MKTKELERIGRKLLPALPQFAIKKQLLFLQPVQHTLRGIFLDRSSNPTGFYVQVFIKPLFVPSQQLSFNIGWRLGGRSRIWNAEMPDLAAKLSAALVHEALPFLFSVNSYRDVAAAAANSLQSQHLALQESGPYNSSDPIRQQSIAYALLLAGDIKEANEALNRLIELLKGDATWQTQLRKTAFNLKGQLAVSVETAQAQLRAWELETANSLGLARHI